MMAASDHANTLVIETSLRINYPEKRKHSSSFYRSMRHPQQSGWYSWSKSATSVKVRPDLGRCKRCLDPSPAKLQRRRP